MSELANELKKKLNRQSPVLGELARFLNLDHEEFDQLVERMGVEKADLITIGDALYKVMLMRAEEDDSLSPEIRKAIKAAKDRGEVAMTTGMVKHMVIAAFMFGAHLREVEGV